MAVVYCRKHPSVRLNWLGSCPRCESEAKNNQLQITLIREQQEANRIATHANKENQRLQEKLISEQQATRSLLENQKQEMQTKRNQEMIKAGIVEFESDFQYEWNRVAKKYKKLLRIQREIDSLISSRLELEFQEAFTTAKLPATITTEVDAIYDLDGHRNELNQIHKSIDAYSSCQFQFNDPGNNANKLALLLRDYINNKAYADIKMPDCAVPLVISSVSLLFFLSRLFILTFDKHYMYETNFRILAIGSGIVGIWSLFVALRKIKRKNQILKKRTSARLGFDKLATYLSGEILKIKWEGTEKVTHGFFKDLDVVLRSSFNVLKENLRSRYSYTMIAKDSPSPTGRELYSVLNTEDRFSSLEDFENSLGEYAVKFQYMKKAIIEIGEEIQEGHRVASRMKKKRIELMKCPACSGPLAKDGTSSCHYCGNQFIVN